MRRLGLIALVASRRLELVDLATCTAKLLARGETAGIRFRPDGRWLAYSRVVNSTLRGPVVVPALGGRARRLLGAGITAWQWTPTGERLYGITGGGSLVTASATGSRRVLAKRLGSGAALAVLPDGRRVAVDRSRCYPPVGELDVIDLRTGARTIALRHTRRFFTLAGWSPDGRWLLFWWDSDCSASIAADGLPLDEVPATGGHPVQAISHMLLYSDFLSWCDGSLIAAAGPYRDTEAGGRLVKTAPPAWRQGTIQPAHNRSWVSPSCLPQDAC